MKTNCKLQILGISPPEYIGPWILKEGFALAAGDHEFIPLVRYTEPDDYKISSYGDTFMEILANKNTPLPPVGLQHIVTLRATALESPFCDLACKIWVDETRRLRIATQE